MGIIKTAMVSGVGIYGINKLLKAQEIRQSSPAPNNYPQNYNNYPPQGPQGPGHWGPPGPPPHGSRQGAPREDAYFSENPNQQQRQWYPAQGPADGRYTREYYVDSEDKYASQDREFVNQPRDRQYATPPPYGSQRQALPYEPRGSAEAERLSGTARESVGKQESGYGTK